MLLTTKLYHNWSSKKCSYFEFTVQGSSIDNPRTAKDLPKKTVKAIKRNLELLKFKTVRQQIKTLG